MSLLARKYGGDALACDGKACGKRFFPRGPRSKDAAAIRERAAGYGWTTRREAAGAAVVMDLCPDCSEVR